MIQKKTIRIVIADDNDMIRYGMNVVMDSVEDFELVGAASNGPEAIEICRRTRPDALLIDLIMPGMSGVAVIREIRRELPEIHCIALTSYEDASLVYEALHAGATSYLIKNMTIDTLAEAIRGACDGRVTLSREAMESVQLDSVKRASLPPLAPPETAILQGLIDGQSDAEIASHLALDHAALTEYIDHLMTRFSSISRGELIVQAIRHRFLSIGE